MSVEKEKKGPGHPRNFETPYDLINAWEAYKESLIEEAKNWPKIQYVGKEGERMVDYPVLPYTFEGFKRFCRNNYGEVEQYFVNAGNLYDKYISVCRAIKEEIREHQITGGLLNFFNPSITQRLNNLKEGIDHSGEITNKVVRVTIKKNE